jgi:hypothetical protein
MVARVVGLTRKQLMLFRVVIGGEGGYVVLLADARERWCLGVCVSRRQPGRKKEERG